MVFLKLCKNGWSNSLDVKTISFTLYVSYLNLKAEVSSYKINGFIGIYISNLKWAWQAQFVSHTPLIFKNSLFFVDNQIIVVIFFKISSSFKDTKNLILFPIQFFSHLCLSIGLQNEVLHAFEAFLLLNKIKKTWRNFLKTYGKNTPSFQNVFSSFIQKIPSTAKSFNFEKLISIWI